MKFVCTIKTNKRGKKYTTRPNKIANGFMKHYGNDGKIKDEIRRLAVFGTLDKLARFRFDIVWITIEHPTDKGYYKKVAILKKNKAKYINKYFSQS